MAGRLPRQLEGVGGVTPDGLHTVIDIEGKHVLVISEDVFRRGFSKALAWFFSAGIVYLVAAVWAWAKILEGQTALRQDITTMQQTMVEWRTTAPAPAESTRMVLQAFGAEIRDLTLDLRALRRELGRPR